MKEYCLIIHIHVAADSPQEATACVASLLDEASDCHSDDEVRSVVSRYGVSHGLIHVSVAEATH